MTAPNHQAPASNPLPPVSLPRGGGAIQGIGEKFQANPVTGTGSIMVPVAVPPGRSGFAPDLALSYDSGAGNSPFGLGWNVPVAAVRRKTQTGLPTYRDASESDVFLLAETEDLVPAVDGDGARVVLDDGGFRVFPYRPRIEGGFARIERWVDPATAMAHWRSVSRDNVTTIFGESGQARITDPDDQARVFAWLAERRFDDKGNVVHFTYKPEDATHVSRRRVEERNRLRTGRGFTQKYLKHVRYGNTVPFRGQADFLDQTGWLFHVVLDYGEHDADSPSPEEVRPWPARADPFSSYRARFEVRTYRLCRRLLAFHHLAELGETPCLVRSTDLIFDENSVATRTTEIAHRWFRRDAPDADGYVSASLPPLRFAYSDALIEPQVHALDAEDAENLPAGVDGGGYRWTDLGGEGLTGVLSETDGAWYYKPNLGGGRLGPKQRVDFLPSAANPGDARQQLMDLGGDGRSNLVMLSPELKGFYEWESLSQPESFTAFASAPTLDWTDPNARLVDLNGDGHADLLVTEDECLCWFPSTAKGGFSAAETVAKALDEEDGPRVVFADGTQSIYLADMSGDGLDDIVRVRSGSVCYWPNTGYGTFATKVTMSDAPWLDHPDAFEQARVRLADLDGSGPTDLVYLGRNGVRLWFNQSGNGWGAVHELPELPFADSVSSVSVTDLLGRGTACVAWSSPLEGDRHAPLRYVDLMARGKPHLLTEVDNQMGGIVRLAYAPSTKFYVDDRENGRPWVTRLPFPVHVLQRVEILEEVTGSRYVTSYAYHHGYFDGDEREFRGFGMVEQFDTETVTGPHEASNVPPVLTRSWFHTGFFRNGQSISRQYEQEYFAGDTEALNLPDTRLPPGLSADELGEACRALKGSLLHQEVYSLDGTSESATPYAVTEHTYHVRRVQGRAENRHAVFLVHPEQALTYHYERDPADPRTTQQVTLDVDTFGNVTRSAALAHPRRGAGHPQEQRRLLVTCEEADFINVVNRREFQRLGVPSESRTYEVTGLETATILSAPQLRAALADAEEIAFEVVPTPGALQRRLIRRSQTRYYDDAMAGPLPAGEVAFHGLPFETFQLAFTRGLLEEAYEGRVSDDMLADEGGYANRDGAWWAPSGRTVFDPDRFYLPVRQLDPFGAETAVAYDGHGLLPVSVTDPKGNTTSAQNDYRVLQPFRVTDPNANQTEAAFDLRGLVVAIAVQGKAGAESGDSVHGDGFPHATTRLEYDPFNWAEHRRPNFSHTLVRERHGPSNERFQESFLYTDGLGREALTKAQAEPGDAFLRDAGGALLRDPDDNPVRGFAERRWIGSGRTVRNNKGDAVRQYEPYFSSTPDFEGEDEVRETGVTPVLRYDPLGRVIRTDLPDGTFSEVTFTPWIQERHDPNDTVLGSTWFADRGAPDPAGHEPSDPDARAAFLAARHAATPAVAHADTLGRMFLGVADNGGGERFETRSELDIQGNTLVVIDARGIEVARSRYNLLGWAIRTTSADAGGRWTLANVTGNPVRRWDSRGHGFRLGYDGLQRPTHVVLRTAEGPDRTVELLLYGEAHPDAIALNLRGSRYQHYDQSGRVTAERFDFKGNPRASSRRLTTAFEGVVDWSPLEALTAAPVLDLPALDAGAAGELDDEVFTSETEYDALDRPIQVRAPDGSILRPEYNQASLLERLHLRHRGQGGEVSFVEDVDYNEKGQRTRIAYGNGTATEFAYDEETFRLDRLRTTRSADGAVLQDLRYTYDPSGNLMEVRDDAQQTVFFANAPIEPGRHFSYDGLYRLVEATGREHIGQVTGQVRTHEDVPAQPLPHPNDAQALRTYTERYNYDPVGNILRLVHAAGDGSWTRQYAYAPDSNRLLSHTLPDDAVGAFEHDAHGNMLRMPHLPDMAYDHADRLREIDLGGGGRAFYVYDSAGQRVRKVIQRQGSLVDERIDLGGFEVFRRRNAGGLQLERQTLHVMDDEERLALVETRTVDTASPSGVNEPVPRFQLGDHQRCVSLETDAQGAVITYEEYHPYGTSAYRAGRSAADVSLKRYRYTAAEYDDETGLACHGVRYYASWLGRWTSADPTGLADGVNRYAYARGSPTLRSDLSGTKAERSLLVDLLGQQVEIIAAIANSSSDAQREGLLAELDIVGQQIAAEANQLTGSDEGPLPELEVNYNEDVNLTDEALLAQDAASSSQPYVGRGLGEGVKAAWQQGTVADRVELAASGVGLASAAVPYFGDYGSAAASLVSLVAKPSWENAGNLGLDAAGAILPVVGPLGTVRRLDKADAARDIERAGDTISAPSSGGFSPAGGGTELADPLSPPGDWDVDSFSLKNVFKKAPPAKSSYRGVTKKMQREAKERSEELGATVEWGHGPDTPHATTPPDERMRLRLERKEINRARAKYEKADAARAREEGKFVRPPRRRKK